MHVDYFVQTGLAVEDVKQLQRKAKETRIKHKVGLTEAFFSPKVLILHANTFHLHVDWAADTSGSLHPDALHLAALSLAWQFL